MPQNQADDFEQWRAQRQPRRPADELADFARQRGATVTSTTGGQHNPGSKHYTGEAVDIRTRDRSDDEVDDLMDEAESYGYTVRDERQRPAGQGVWGGPHLHVEAPDPNDDFAQWRNQRQKQTQELQGSGWHAPQALPGTPQQPARPQTRLQSPSRAPMITRQPAPRPAPPVRPQSMQKGPVRQTSGNVDPFRWDYPQQHSMAWDMANREKKYPTSPEVAAQQKQQEEFAKQSLPRQAWEAAKQVPGRVISNLGSTAQRLETIGTGLAQGDAKPLLGTIGQLGTGAVIGTAKAAENVLGMMGDGPETPTRQRLAQERQAWERAQALARQDYETGARKYLDDPNALTFDEMRQLQARQEAEAQLTNTPTANITRAVGDALPAVALGAAGGMPAALGTQAAMGNVEQPLDTAVNMASVAVPMGLTRAARPGLNAATQAMRPLPRAVARTAGEMGIGAAGNVGQSLVTQPLLRGRIDPQQLAEDAAVGAVFGASDAAQGMHAERVAPRQLAERMRGQLDAARTFNDRLSTFNRQIDPVTDELIRRQTQPRAQTGQSNPASNLSSSHPVTTPQNAGQFQFTNDLQARVPGKLAITVTGADGKPVRALYDRGQFESRNAAEAAARKAYEQTQQPAERTRRGGQSPYVVLDESEWNNDPTPGYKQSVVKVGETEHLIEYDPKQIGVAAAGAKAKREIAEAQQRIGENQAQRAAQAMRQSARPEAPTQADNAPTFEPTPAPVETGFETNVSTRAANADQIIAEMVNRGRLPQLTEIRDRMGVTRTEAQQIQADIAAEQRAVRTQSRTERKQPLGQTQEPAAAPQTPTVEEAPQQRPRLLTGTDGRRQGVPPAQPMRPNLRPASVDRMPRRQFTETESPAPDNVVPLRRPPSPESPRRPLRLAGPSDKSADFPKEQRSLAQLGRAVEQARAAGTEDQGPFGRIARQGFKSTEADGIKGHTAFFNEPSVKGVLGLDPDASMGEVKAQFNRTFAKLLRQRDTEEVSLTQVPLDAWNAWMRRNRSLLSDEARRRFEVLKRSYQEGELAREIEKATAIDPERPEQGTSRTEAASQPVVIGAESGTRRPSATDNETAPARRGAASRPEQGLSDAARNVETNPAADFIERIIRENDGLGRDRLIRESGLTRSHIVPALNELKQQGRIEERDGALRVVTPAGGDQISNPSAESHIAVSEPPLAGLPKDKESAAAEARPRAVTEQPVGSVARPDFKEPDAAPGKIVELGSGLNLIQAYRDLSRLASKGGRALGRVGEAKTKPPVPQHFDMDAYLHDADKDVIKRDLPRAALPHYEDAVQKVIDAYDADDGVALMRANDKLLQVLGKYGKTDVKRTLASLGGLSRSLVFSGDFNFLRGSLNTMLRNPKQFFKQPVHGLGAFLSKDAAIEARARLHADPDWQRWLNAGMFSVTEAKHGIDFNPLNIDDSLMGHAADKIPVLKQIERANEVMIDEARLSVVKDLGEMHNAKLDRIMDGDEYYAARDRYDQQVAKFANAITGRANLATEGKAGAVVNVSSSLLTSARYMASFLDSLWQGAKLVKLEPKAAPAVATYLATRMLVTAGLTAGVNALLGQSTNTDDPRSEDFWKIKVGDNETHDFSGGSLPYWRMMTRVADIATSDSPPRAKAAQIFDVLKDFSLQRVAPVPRELTRVVLTAIGRDQKEERPLVEDGLASLAESFIPIFIQSGIETGVKYGRDEGIKAAVMSVLGDNASKYERLNRPLPALSGDTPLGREMRRLDVRQVEKDDPLSTMYNPAPYRDLRRVGKFQERPVADTIFGKGIAPVESSDSYERRISQADALWRQAGNETLNSPQYRALPDPLKAKVLGRLRGQIAAATEDERPRPVRPAQIIREVVEAAKVDSREKRERRLRPELRGLR